jgi:deoxyribose-phosphate aldolase
MFLEQMRALSDMASTPALSIVLGLLCALRLALVQVWRKSMTFNTQLNLTTAAKITLSCMDLTSLTGVETESDIISLCQQANTSIGHTAAICIYPQYIKIAKQYLDPAIKLATVTNFPIGGSDVAHAVKETQQAVALGADEVDVVFPYQALINGEEQLGYDLVKQCKAACANHVMLKVIIESGELQTPELIALATRIAIDAGADFVKTSTGKVPVNATLEAAETMLEVISQSGKNVGFKAAGGVRNVAEAKHYIELAAHIMGEDWVVAEHFRFGASSLLTDVLASLNVDTQSVTNEGD